MGTSMITRTSKTGMRKGLDTKEIKADDEEKKKKKKKGKDLAIFRRRYQLIIEPYQ